MVDGKILNKHSHHELLKLDLPVGVINSEENCHTKFTRIEDELSSFLNFLNSHSKEKSKLTAREMEVINLIAQGYSNKKIAEILMLKEQSVKNLITRILQKSGFENRTQIALSSVKAGSLL